MVFDIQQRSLEVEAERFKIIILSFLAMKEYVLHDENDVVVGVNLGNRK